MQDKWVESYIDQGIFFGKYQKNIEITLDMAKQLVAERLVLQNGTDYPMLIYMNGMKTASKEVRTYFATEGVKGVTMAAFIVKNVVDELIFNFFIYVDKPPRPSKAFTNEADAIRWINEMRSKNSQSENT